MITQENIDSMMLDIQDNKDVYIYYIAHMVECREGYIDEYKFKSVQDFRVLKLKVNSISNAYFEYLNYKNNPSKYHTEQEESYLDEFTKYIYYYTVPNKANNTVYTKDFNPRMPSIVYGVRRKVYRSGILVGDYSDPSPILPEYIKTMEYSNLSSSEVTRRFNNHKLDWKYQKRSTPIINDGISYNYITSDWYILDIENFPRTEKPLINVKQKTAYFMSNIDAQYYLKQLQL